MKSGSYSGKLFQCYVNRNDLIIKTMYVLFKSKEKLVNSVIKPYVVV